MGASDQTLVFTLQEKFEISDDDQFFARRIIVWNHETSRYVSELNYKEKVAKPSYINEVEVRVEHICLAGGKLAVNLSVKTEQSVTYKYQTQIWMLDTADPSAENIQHLTTIDNELLDEEGNIFGMLMNSKLICFAIYSYTSKKVLLQVFLVDFFLFKTTTIVGEIEEDFNELDCDIEIEEESSYKIVVFNGKRNLLKVYKFDGTNDALCLEIDLNHLIVNGHGALWMTNFLRGKIMLTKDFESKFQCVIVTENGEVIEGNKQPLMDEDDGNFWFSDDGIVSFSSNTTADAVAFYHP